MLAISCSLNRPIHEPTYTVGEKTFAEEFSDFSRISSHAFFALSIPPNGVTKITIFVMQVY